METNSYVCQRCGVALQGNAELCVKCYRETWFPCPDCGTWGADGKWRVRRVHKTGLPVDCKRCHNERWVKIDWRRRSDSAPTS